MIDARIHKILFGPDDNIEKFIVDQIDSSKRNITMLVFWFTWKPIADAIIRANDRGVRIKMILDSRSNEVKLKDVDIKNETLIPKYIDERTNNACRIYIYNGELLHHKTILIDDDIVLTGSCNFFNASIRRHEENYMLIESRELKHVFQQRFAALLHNSKEYKS